MDAIDILGGLFGRKRGSSGQGTDLGDTFGRGKQSAPDTRGGSSSSSTSASDIDAQARELEDMLNVAHERDVGRRSSPAPQTRPTAQPSFPQQAPSGGGIPVDGPFSQSQQSGSRQNELALVLSRAMVNAAKADGQISSAEQQSILQQFEGGSAEAIQFLRDELSRPLDVRDFAWSVPIGMEQQVYAMSLMAIDVDSQAETRYLDELAHGLRLPNEVRQQLHQRFRGAFTR